MNVGRGSGIYDSIKSGDLAGLSAARPSVGDAPAAASPSAPQGGYVDIPVSNIRGVIAKRLLESKQTIPHYYVTVECQVDNVSFFFSIFKILFKLFRFPAPEVQRENK